MPPLPSPVPESLDRFGANTACRVCGQVLRLEDQPPIPEPPARVQKQEETAEVEFSGPYPLPPIDQLLVDAWSLFRGRMGLCIGSFSVSLVLRLLSICPELYGNHLLQNRPLSTSMQVLLALGIAITVVFRIGLFVWLDIGFHQILLKVVRQQPTEMRDLFRGGRFFWRAILCTLLFEIAVLIGLFLGILPGILVALIFWPYLFVLIDNDSPGLTCLPIAAVLTQGNKTALLGVFGICFLFVLFGFISLIVGALIALPYTFLVFALAYESISHDSSSGDADEESDHA